MAYFMKDDVNDEVSNGNPKITILSNGLLNWDETLRLSIRPKGDHVTHL
jgi:hypothetical protein